MNVEVICDDRNENGQIEIGIETPREIEIPFMRKGGTRGRGNAARYRRLAARRDNGVVGDEPAAGK